MAASLRTKPLDRRRLTANDRAIYNPKNRLSAIAKVKQYKAHNAWMAQKKPFATEQKPGTGGFTGGLWQQQQRLRDKGNEKMRVEQYRSEELIKPNIADKSFSTD